MEGEESTSQSKVIWRKLLPMAIVSGLVFWVTTIAISLLSISAEYRAAELIPNMQTVWAGGLVIGMILGFLVCYFLLRFFNKIPTRDPILKSVVLSLIALVIILILIEVPASLRTNDALYWFLVGVMLNLPRFLFFGIAMGYLYKRLSRLA